MVLQMTYKILAYVMSWLLSRPNCAYLRQYIQFNYNKFEIGKLNSNNLKDHGNHMERYQTSEKPKHGIVISYYTIIFKNILFYDLINLFMSNIHNIIMHFILN